MSAPTPPDPRSQSAGPAGTSSNPATPSDALPNDSAADAAGDDGSGQPPQKKQRRVGRGVASLTPEQLARKRANDREAQRAIRERTKDHIDRLNSRIRELESQNPYRELQRAVREKEAVQSENDDIRRRLVAVLDVLQPIVGGTQGLDDLATAALRPPQPGRNGVGETDKNPSTNAPPPIHNDPSSQNQWAVQGGQAAQNVRGGWSPRNMSNVPFQQPQDDRLGLDFLIDHNIPSRLPNDGAYSRTQPAYQTTTRNCSATCPLDSLLLDCLAERRARISEGMPMSTVLGPSYPNVGVFLPSSEGHNAGYSHPLSKFLTDILRTFPDISNLPEQVAVVYIMFLILRWQISPTRENYDRLPDWITPRASQILTAHPAWMDHIPWPRMRDRIIESYSRSFDHFFIPFTTTLSLNWPYEPRDVLVPASSSSPGYMPTQPGPPSSANSTHGPSVASPAATYQTSHSPSTPSEVSEQWQINPVFESHLRDLRNWSLGPSFRETFPELVMGVTIKDRR